ncbi:hypothetical protein [Prosthecomicrobium sp. N25]|uniref:hypothetical protein n=1 Tax=Prosthecomicrobium sp. N25 TaxID=3129254 RepID=UPI003076D7D8
MKKTAVAAIGAALLATSFVSTADAAPRHHHHGGWGWGAGAGLATGLIVGGAVGAAAASSYGPYGYAPGPYYNYAPGPYYNYAPGPYYSEAPVPAQPRVVYRDRIVKQRGCVTSTRYDYKGEPYEWKDCQ